MPSDNKLNPVKMGTYIRKLREERDYSQYYMATYLSISQNTCWMIENGRTPVNITRIGQIADFFDMTHKQFLDGYFDNCIYKLK